MTIGIDGDGILFNYVRTCANYVNSLVRKNVASYETCHSFDNLQAWGVPDLKYAVDKYFETPGVVRYMPLLDGAQDFIDNVRKITDDDFIIVTACPAKWHDEREQALAAYFGVPRKRVHFSHDKSKLKINLLLDDYHENHRYVDGWKLLLDHPWNQDTNGVAVKRCMNYNDCLFEIDRIVNWNK